MSYQVLARKWRPRRFADLVGQEHVVRALGNALNAQRMHHAYLLTGTRGVGKTTIARLLAKSLNCEEGVSAEPCGVCASCQQIEGARSVDLLEIDAASNTGIDNIREVIENAQYLPSSSRYKVYIIDEVHMLSRQAFNAMLKTLEEPPEHVKFILATTDPQKVPMTVLSRCLQFTLRNMTPTQVAGHLAHVLTTEAIEFDAAALVLLARAANGSMRDALSLLDQAIAYGLGRVEEASVRAMLGVVDQRQLLVLIEHLLNADAQAVFNEGRSLVSLGASSAVMLEQLALLFYQLALAQQFPDALEGLESEREVMMQLSSMCSAEDLQLYYQIALTASQQIAYAPDELTAFNMCLLRMLAFRPQTFEQMISPNFHLNSTIHDDHSTKSGRERAHEIAAQLVKKKPLESVHRAVRADLSVEAVHDTQKRPPEISEPAVLKVRDEKRPLEVSEPAVLKVHDEKRPPEPQTWGDWSTLLATLSSKLGAAHYAMLQHVEFVSFEAGECCLRVTPQREQLLKNAVKRLSEVLSEHFSSSILVRLHLSDTLENTPFLAQTREQHERLELAKSTLDQHPSTRALFELFQASYLPESLVLKS